MLRVVAVIYYSSALEAIPLAIRDNCVVPVTEIHAYLRQRKCPLRVAPERASLWGKAAPRYRQPEQ